MVDRTRPPVAGAPPGVRLPALSRGRLASGIEWIHAHIDGLPLVDVQLVVRCGVELDPPGALGLTSLTADLLEEGTDSRTGFDIADAVDRLGASLHVRPGWDETTLALHVLTPRLRDALAIAADVIRNAAFPEAEVRRRRDERLAALMQERDEPAALAARALAPAVYGETHPYGRPPTGTRETVAALERDAIVEFHHDRFGPGATYIVTAGDASPETIENALAGVFGDWSGSAAAGVVPPRPDSAAMPGIHLVDRPDAAQTEMRIGGPGPPRDTPDYAALVVLNTILGGAFTSRLNLKLREEKGFTYGARSSFAFRRGGGPFVAGAAVATDATAEAVSDAVHEIRRLSLELVPDTELERAKHYLALGLPRRLETPAAMAVQLADLHLHGMDASELVAYPGRIAAVSAGAVRDAARRWLDVDRMAIAVVGDAARVREPLEALGLGPVHQRTITL